jgi:hypothetical protein
MLTLVCGRIRQLGLSRWAAMNETLLVEACFHVGFVFQYQHLQARKRKGRDVSVPAQVNGETMRI